MPTSSVLCPGKALAWESKSVPTQSQGSREKGKIKQLSKDFLSILLFRIFIEISPLGINHSLPVFQQNYFNGLQRSRIEAFIDRSTIGLISILFG
ncbi:MAG: hypothetical protein V7K26_20775 [Nostoc sp.]|uniref:hypothetical protein n=1 Tax=Nostoc sp. TaxID=1180 RepID=UPI002FF3F26C